MRIRHRGRSSRRLLAGSALPNSFRLSRGVALACVVVLATVLATAGAAPALANPVGGQASLPACAGLDPSILSTTLPSGSVGAPYSQDVQLFGTLPPFTVAVVSGSLPPGLSVNGQTDSFTDPISGTPTTAGTYNFVLHLTDVIGRACDQPLFIVISQGGPPGSLAVSTMSLPTGTVGTAYSQALTASGGSPPYTSWSVVGGALPPGLSVCSSGTICGTPTTTGTSTFAVEVTDNAGTKASQQLSIAVNHVSGLDPGILSTSLPSGTVGAPYNHDVQLFGTLPPFTVSVVSGSLPPGLSVNGQTDSFTDPISGTPTTAGTYNFVLDLTDVIGRGDDPQPLSITINPVAGPPTAKISSPAGGGTLHGGPVGADGVQLRRRGVRARDRVLRGLQRREWRDGVVDHVGCWSFHVHGDRRQQRWSDRVGGYHLHRGRPADGEDFLAGRWRDLQGGPVGADGVQLRRGGVRARDRVLRGLQRREWRDGVVDHVSCRSFHLHGDRYQRRWSDRFGEYHLHRGRPGFPDLQRVDKQVDHRDDQRGQPTHQDRCQRHAPERARSAHRGGNRRFQGEVQVAIRKVSGRYIGEVAVRDPGDGISTVAAVLTTRLSVSNGLVASTATGLSHRRLYRLAFTL